MNWRLTSEIVAYVIPTEKEVYLAATEKKQYQVKVLKLIEGKPYQEVRLYENQFKIKFGGGDNDFDLYLWCSELPDEWFKVANFYKPGIWNLLENHTVTGGMIEEIFEVTFEEELPYVSFIEPSMKNFKSCFEEMKRKMNCEMCKKTKKWIPGHRYDSYTESIFPLASVHLRKENLTNSQYLTDFDKMPEVWIYVGELGDEKTVSEVLKNRSFGDGPNDLKIAFKTKSMVDVGETLTNDYSGDIKDYWLPIYDNAIKEGKPLKEILDTFSVISNLTTTVSIPTYELENLTQDTIERVLIDCWNLDNVREDLLVGDKNKETENQDRAEKLFVISGIKDTNFLKGLYYPELYKDLGIDLKKLVKDAVQEIKGIKMCHDFDHYLKYLDYWKNPGRVDTNKCCSKQRVKSTNYKLDVVTLKDLYGDSELKDTIIGAVNKVREDFGLGATEYSLINIGNKKEPKEYIVCKLTLDDLIKFKKGVSKMSETLKNEILENHFVWVQVVFDKDGIIS